MDFIIIDYIKKQPPGVILDKVWTIIRCPKSIQYLKSVEIKDSLRVRLGRNCTTAIPDQGVVQLGHCNNVLSVNMEEAHVSRIHDKEGGVYG